MDNKTKILYLITKSNFGGAQKYIYDITANIPKNDFDISVAFGGSGLLKEKLESNNIRTIQLSYLDRNINPFNDIRVFFSLIKLFKYERPDIIHLNSSKIGFLGSLAGRFTCVPKIIFTSHGWAFNEKRNIFSKFIFFKIHLFTILLSHTTIAVSENIKSSFDFPFLSKKIKVIRHGIKSFHLTKRNKAREILLGGSVRYFSDYIWVGTIAELHSNKGLSYAIDAIGILVKKIPNIVYVVVGEGESRIGIEKLIKSHGLEKNVFLVGYKDNAPSLLGAFDIFLLPSITEALGYVLLEAGHAELSVVATKVGGVPEVIEDEKTGLLVHSKDPVALARELEELIKNGEKRELLGKNLNEKVLREFSINRMIKETLDIYK